MSVSELKVSRKATKLSRCTSTDSRWNKNDDSDVTRIKNLPFAEFVQVEQTFCVDWSHDYYYYNNYYYYYYYYSYSYYYYISKDLGDAITIKCCRGTLHYRTDPSPVLPQRRQLESGDQCFVVTPKRWKLEPCIWAYMCTLTNELML